MWRKDKMERESIKYLAVDASRLIFGISVMVAALNMQNQRNKNTVTSTREFYVREWVKGGRTR